MISGGVMKGELLIGRKWCVVWGSDGRRYIDINQDNWLYNTNFIVCHRGLQLLVTFSGAESHMGKPRACY